MNDFRRHLETLLKDPEFSAEYKALEAQLSFARQVIRARAMLGWTQADLAGKVGTSQANISKIENAELNPTIQWMNRIAQGLNRQLRILFDDRPAQEEAYAGSSDVSLTQALSQGPDLDTEPHGDVLDPAMLGFVA